MAVSIRCYGAVREAIGSEEVNLRLGDDETVETLLNRLVENHRQLEDIRGGPNSIIVMRDGTHLERECPVDQGDILRVSTSPMPE